MENAKTCTFSCLLFRVFPASDSVSVVPQTLILQVKRNNIRNHLADQYGNKGNRGEHGNSGHVLGGHSSFFHDFPSKKQKYLKTNLQARGKRAWKIWNSPSSSIQTVLSVPESHRIMP
jgi:hypothetical protein